MHKDMSTTDKFDLKSQINQWKKRMVKSGNFNTKDMEGMQIHLTRLMDNKELVGLNTEERFWIAQHRLSTAGLINQVYADKGILSFEKRSWFVQAMFHFLTFGAYSLTFTTLTNFLFVSLNSQSVTDYLIISFFGQSFAILLTYLSFKIVNRARVLSQSYARSNFMAFISLILPYGLYLLALMRLPESRSLQFSLMTTLFSFLLPLLLFVIFVVINTRVWRRTIKIKKPTPV